MGFKILTEEEKAFLTEKQLEQYQKQLEKYNQRVGFVQKLVKLENVELKPYVAKKAVIRKINKVRVSDITMPDRRIKTENRISQKISEYKLFNKIDSEKKTVEMSVTLKNIQNREQMNITVSKCSKIISKMPVPDIQKVKIEKPDCIVPQIRKSEIHKVLLNNIPDKRYGITDTDIKIKIPAPEICHVKNNSDIKVNPVKIELPECKVKNISLPETQPVKINQIVFNEFNVSGMPEKKNASVVIHQIPDIPSAKVKIPQLSIRSDISVNKIEINKFNVEKIPAVESAVCLVKKFTMPAVNVKTDNVKTRLPEKAVINEFSKPDINIQVPDVKTRYAEKPAIKTVVKPDINLQVSVCKTPEIRKINIDMPGVRITGVSGIRRPDTDSINEKISTLSETSNNNQ